MFDLRVSAYCLMSNHYHLLVQTPGANLSRAMRHLNGVYTQRYNRQRILDGQLFRGRYKSVLVEEDSHLLELLRYIHRNPVRADICSGVKEYSWSSHHGYISKAKKWAWLYKDFLLGMLSEHATKSRSQYLQLVECEDPENVTEFFNKKNIAPFFGSAAFIDWVKAKYHKDKEHPEVPQSKQLAPSLAAIKWIVSKTYGVDEQSLNNTIRGQVNEPRNVAIYLARKRSGLGLQEIGCEFGLDKYSSVSSVVCRTEQQLPKNPTLRKKINRIIGELAKSQAKT